MAEPTDSGNGNIGNAPAGAAPPSVQVRVVGQYIKDLSFENPNVRKLLEGPGEKPALRVEVNVNATKLADKMFESAILFKAEAASKTGVIYDLELAYAGLFEIQNLPEQALEPFLLINCPSLLFPVPAAHRCRPDAGRRLPAAAARPDRFRRPVHAAPAAGPAGRAAEDELRRARSGSDASPDRRKLRSGAGERSDPFHEPQP